MHQKDTSMKHFTDFSVLTTTLRQTDKKKIVALACPHDSHTQKVINMALDNGIAEFILTAGRQVDENLSLIIERHKKHVKLIECGNDEEAARVAVETAKAKRADILMKGTLNTDVLLHAALDKQSGILKKGRVMTHIAMAQIQGYKKILMFCLITILSQLFSLNCSVWDIHISVMMYWMGLRKMRKLHLQENTIM